MSLKLFLLMSIIIFVISTVGFGANLNNDITFNKIGGDDNILVPVPDVDITNVILTESGGNIISSTITVRNTDNVSHSYNICVITKAGILISDTVGTSSDCTLTSSISVSDTGSAVVNFANPLNSLNVDYSNIVIQEIT